MARKQNSARQQSPHSRDSTGEEAFTCKYCGKPVTLPLSGTRHRNHCPHCLWSRHVDGQPGDRTATCGGLMEPIAVWAKRNGEWALFHRCDQCGWLRANRIAGDDNQVALLSLAMRPIANPPFPLLDITPATGEPRPKRR